MASLIIGIRILSLTEKRTKSTDDLIILGQIATVIKLLIVVLMICVEVYFFTETYEAVRLFSDNSLLYFSAMISFGIWNIISIFNFFACVSIAKKNREVEFLEIENIGRPEQESII